MRIGRLMLVSCLGPRWPQRMKTEQFWMDATFCSSIHDRTPLLSWLGWLIVHYT
jgi:hypothetical protein